MNHIIFQAGWRTILVILGDHIKSLIIYGEIELILLFIFEIESLEGKRLNLFQNIMIYMII